MINQTVTVFKPRGTTGSQDMTSPRRISERKKATESFLNEEWKPIARAFNAFIRVTALPRAGHKSSCSVMPGSALIEVSCFLSPEEQEEEVTRQFDWLWARYRASQKANP